MSWLAALTIIGLYVSLGALARAIQSRQLYAPQQEYSSSPADIQLDYESAVFQASDGIRLSGWFVPARTLSGVILFCHGNSGNISHRLEHIEIFHSLGLSTFIFDYRGYGQSEGKPSEQGTYLDAEGAWRYLVRDRQIASSDIVVFGRSLGGAIAAHLAEKKGPSMLIIDSTFTSVQDLRAELYPYFPFNLLSPFLNHNTYNVIATLPSINVPVLIAHSRQDEVVPFKHSLELFNIANDPKEFLELSGNHNEGYLVSGGKYRAVLSSFISKHSQS